MRKLQQVLPDLQQLYAYMEGRTLFLYDRYMKIMEEYLCGENLQGL